MRNLSVVDTIETIFSHEQLPLSATTFDEITGDLICALGPSSTNPIIELRRCKSSHSPANSDNVVITSWDAPCPLPELAHDVVLSLRYFHETEEICVVLAGGDLVLVREHPQSGQDRIEIVGSIDVGIVAVQWSWDSSLLAVVTKSGSLVLMTRQLEPVHETILQQDDLRLSKHVSVGWGKKETQFQGKRAKALRDPTLPDFIDEGKPSACDDGATKISWRGDCAFLAVNSTFASTRRVIRIYSADGVLDSVSEPVDGLEHAVSWRPHGNLIAAIKRTVEPLPKLEVVFFERNGLRHGEFDTRLGDQELSASGGELSLAWNSDSTILSVTLQDRVQLWTMSNYHYSLKQEYKMPDPSFIWHTRDPLKFCLHNSELARSVSILPKFDCGSNCPPFDYGLVAVIDGRKLKLTPLKHVNIPPPMAYTEVSADENIMSCAISRTCQRLAFVTDKSLYLCTWEMRQVNRKSESAVQHTTNLRIVKKDLGMFPCPTQLIIQNDDTVLLLDPATSTVDPQARCYKYTWVNTTTDSPALMVHDVVIPLDTRQLIADTRQESFWFRTSTDIISADLNEKKTFRDHSLTTMVQMHSEPEDSIYAVSLSNDKQLYVGNRHCASQVTSYAVTDTHLVYTTSNHLLKFAHLLESARMQFPADTPEVDERCRAIEKEAQIVTVIPSNFAVVLQMPRGNLETIYPRILVLTGIRNHITDLQYIKAFLACRTHQVDLNILFDYNPIAWLSSTEKFIDQLHKPSRLDEFIQKLVPENVTHQLYHDTRESGKLVNGTPSVSDGGEDKVNRICDALIQALSKRSAEYQQNIITAQICKRPPDIKAALQLVASLKHTSPEEADLAVSHLCFLSDPSRLYDAALSLYDLELALLVAQNAQRDPREYMPFLQSLHNLSELRRQYTIDNHLKNFPLALNHLHALGAHDEVEAYAVKHSLYSTALTLYANSPERLSAISRLHADYLTSQSQHLAAATLYESLSDYDRAYSLYALAHSWRESLTCASLLPLPPADLKDLAMSLATSATELNRDYRAAATIYLDYLSDPLTAAELLCKASYFNEAMRVLSLASNVPHLSTQIPSIIDPMLTRKFGEIVELIADCQTQLSAQVPRIEELRLKKEKDPLAFYGGDADGAGDVDIPDNVSLALTDASTQGGQSMFTRYGAGAGGSQASTKFAGTVASGMSRMTSKTRRREERKRARGKKGSVYEEEYLVASVGRLIERVNGTHEEVRRLEGGLRRRGMRVQAGRVGEIMDQIEEKCRDAKKRVWLGNGEVGESDLARVHAMTGNEGQHAPNEGMYGGLVQGHTENGITKEPPKVIAWKVAV